MKARAECEWSSKIEQRSEVIHGNSLTLIIMCYNICGGTTGSTADTVHSYHTVLCLTHSWTLVSMLLFIRRFITDHEYARAN